jgi:hypothetical protein
MMHAQRLSQQLPAAGNILDAGKKGIDGQAFIIRSMRCRHDHICFSFAVLDKLMAACRLAI